MTSDEIQLLGDALREQGIETAPGLTIEQVRAIEEDFGITFPPDLAALLRAFVPKGDDFPDWHAAPNQDLIEWFDYPSDGIAFDVEENGFWFDASDARPEDVDDAVEEAVSRVAEAPILIPLHGQRFLPSRPSQDGNPVFSVVQSDVAVYSEDLRGFFEKAFGLKLPARKKPAVRTIEFWSELARE